MLSFRHTKQTSKNLADTTFKEFIKLNRLNFHNRYLQFIVSKILKFHKNHCSYRFDEPFCSIGKNSVTMLSSNKNLKTTFQKTKLGIQSLSYMGPNTGNSLLGIVSDSFKHINMLTTDNKYSRSNRENLPLPIERPLSEKLKTCIFGMYIH